MNPNGGRAHEWTLVVTYDITRKEADNVHRQRGKVALGRQNITGTEGPKCKVCGQEYATRTAFCPGPGPSIVRPVKGLYLPGDK